MISRIIVAFSVIPFIIFSLFENLTGGLLFFIFALLCSYFSVFEFFNMLKTDYPSSLKYKGVFLTVLTVILCFLITRVTKMDIQIKFLFILPFLILSTSLFVVFFSQILKNNFKKALEYSATAIFPVIYIGFGFGALILLRSFHVKGPYLVLYSFIVVWLTDSFALFTGKFFGKHKLNLPVSPNKTYEGFIGGVLFALLGAAALKLVFPVIFSGWWIFNWIPYLLMTLGLSLLGQFGDLIESLFKRSGSVKDSDSSIPGHGGFLDVFDAQIFISPFVYVIAVVFSK